jgi:hypothetical protein
MVCMDSIDCYYFAYGSNLSHNLMVEERLKDGDWTGDGWHKEGIMAEPKPVDMGFYQLKGYEFSYSLDCTSFGEGFAGTVTKKEGSTVFGIVYRLTKEHFAILDDSESVNWINPEEGAYFRETVKVYKHATNTFDSEFAPEEITAHVYIGNPKFISPDISYDDDYVSHLIQFARERLFPQDYILRYFSKPESAFISDI